MTTSVSTRAAGTLNPTRRQLDELDALLQRMLELPVNKIDEEEQAENEESLLALHHPSSVLDSPLEDDERAIEDGGQEPTAPPASYVVIETASPRPVPPASGFEPRPATLQMSLTAATPAEVVEENPQPVAAAPIGETPALPSESETWVPLRSTWQPSPQTWPPLADSWHQTNGAAPVLNMTIPIPSAPLDLTFSPAPEPLRSVPLSPASPEKHEPEMPAVEPTLRLSAQDAPRSVPWTYLPLLWFNQGYDACLAPLGAPGRWLRGPGRQAVGFVGLACLAAAVVIAVTAGLGWTWWASLVE
jgi:hypothetical protein